MNNIEEMFTNNEIVNNIADSLGDFPQSSSAKYALWIISRSTNEEPTDEFFIYEFDTPEEAINKAEDINFKFIEEQLESSVLYYCSENEISHFSIEVETVVPDPDDEDSTINIGTIYRRELRLDEVYNSEEIGLDGEPVVAISASDYELLEDNTLKISKEILKDYNKNDFVNIYFADDPDSDILQCKIVSKVTYKDGDYYHCEINF